MNVTVPPPTLRALTGLRFVAAFHVLLLHTALGFLQSAPPAVRNIVRAGTASVSLFFVLSGFILAYQYLDLDGTRPLDRRTFWWARVARVYPVYLFALLFALPPFFGWAGETLARGPAGWAAVKIGATVAANVTLMQGWIPQTVGPMNPPGWSLSVEALCYLLFPVVAVQVARLTRGRAVAAVGTVWALALVATALFSWADSRGVVAADARDLLTSVLKFNPLVRFPEFVIGVLVGRLFLERQLTRRLSAYGAVLSLGAAAAALGVLSQSDVIPPPLIEGGLLAPLFATLIYGLALGRGPLAWLLARPWMVLLGQASYAIYLLHMRAAEYVVAIAHRLAGPLPAVPLYAFYLAVTFALSVTVFLFIEEPARRSIRRAGRRPERVPPTVVRPPARTPAGGVPIQ